MFHSGPKSTLGIQTPSLFATKMPYAVQANWESQLEAAWRVSGPSSPRYAHTQRPLKHH